MALIDSSSRVGRSQGVSFFWGLVSVFFAAAACFYFWKNHENESAANKFRDEVRNLQDQCDTLSAEKDKLQASMSDSAGQMKTREEFLDEKEAKLAAQEAKLESLGMKPPSTSKPAPPAPPPSSATVPKKFTDTITKLGQTDGADVSTHGGRPVLRLPNTALFAPGDATLKPDGQALLNQIAQSLTGVSDIFELRIDSFTDTDMESTATDPAATKSSAKKDAATKPHFANSWELTSARAAAISRYFRDQTSLTFQNVLISSRGDSLPIATGAKDVAKNRRIEISLAPLPASFHSDASVNPLTPPPDAPPAKDKDKSKDKDKADKPKDKDKDK